MGFFGVPLSGLLASQAQLQAVSNNLANLDTVGFKDQTVSFSDLFAQNSLLDGANNPVVSALGVTSSQTSTNFTDVAPTTTGISSNMALSGNGFFVAQTASGAQNYTRAGNFTANADGVLVTSAGETVMGYPAVNGVVSTSSPLQALQVGLGSPIAATATNTISMQANLDSRATTTTTPFASTVNVYDSLGSPHELTTTYTKTGTNSWNYAVTIPAADTTSGTTQVAQGSLTFNGSGVLTSPTGNVALNVTGLTDGAADLNIQWNLHDSSGNPVLTQTAENSTTSGNTQNGRQSGTLTGFNVGADGTIEGTYSNGQTSVALGQVVVATFYNTQGLVRTGDNNYSESAGSGQPSIGIAGTGGRGIITGGAIENSNVDVATEFAKMIVAQQAYQANAKTITTLDQISQTIIQMISG